MMILDQLINCSLTPLALFQFLPFLPMAKSHRRKFISPLERKAWFILGVIAVLALVLHGLNCVLGHPLKISFDLQSKHWLQDRH